MSSGREDDREDRIKKRIESFEKGSDELLLRRLSKSPIYEALLSRWVSEEREAVDANKLHNRSILLVRSRRCSPSFGAAWRDALGNPFVLAKQGGEVISKNPMPQVIQHWLREYAIKTSLIDLVIGHYHSSVADWDPVSHEVKIP